MRRAYFGVVVLVCASAAGWSTVVSAQTQTLTPRINYNFYGGGARALSMGGAFIGISDDASAATWNPAGLTQQDRIFTGFDYGVTGQEVNNTLTSSQNLGFLHDNTSTQALAQFSFLAINGPTTIKGQRLHFSVAWTRLNQLNFESEATITDFSDFTLDPSSPFSQVGVRLYNFTRGGPEVATLAAATAFKEDVFSLGFGLNIYLGSQYDSSQVGSDVDLDLGSGDTLSLRVIEEFRNNIDYTGLNFNVGALFQASTFSIGATLKTPFRLSQDNDVRVATTQYERTPDTLLLLTETSVLVNTETQVDMPLQIGVGVTYRPQDNLILSVDYEFKNFSSSMLYSQADILDPKSELISMDPEWKNIHQFRFGLEYTVDVGWGQVPVRAGFRTAPQPYSQLTEARSLINDVEGLVTHASLGDQVIGEVYTLGAGVNWRKVRFDLTWELTSSTWFIDGIYTDTFTQPEYIYEQKVLNQRLLFGFTGFF